MALRNTPIRRKLMTIIMLTTAVALAVMCASFFVYELVTFRQGMVRQVSTQAEIIASNSTAALAFDNKSDAEETLSALKADSHIVAACLFDKKGKLFACYPPSLSSAVLPAAPARDGYRFQGSDLVAYSPVVQGSSRLGTLYLKSSGIAMTERFRLYGLIASLVIFVTLLVAFAISTVLERQISRPILSLTEMAKVISEGGDYSLRATKLGDDELGVFIDSFNEMLTRIQNQKDEEDRLTMEKWEAEHASTAKSEFLSRMSHELRTPLNAVLGYAQLLQMNSKEPKTVSAAETILKSGRHLLGLINEVLDLARIEAGKLTLSMEPVPISSTISHSIDLVRPLAQERGITIEVTSEAADGFHVNADRQRLVQVLLNLLTNAAKYNEANGRIFVKCMEGEETHRIEVTDTGHGIGQENIGRLFQPFERVGDQSIEGTGLGLALSHNLMKLMGGSLSLARTGADGSTFVLELPKASAPAADLSAIPASERGTVGVTGQLRIVYIEDNLSNVRLLESVFEGIGGVELIPAMQATLGIQMVQDHLPDVVLLDLHLPDKPGLEVLRELRQDPKTAKIPIVILSADATQHQIETLLSEGAKAYLTKPIDLPTLFAQLNEIRAGLSQAA